jgi:hypothetical protein
MIEGDVRISRRNQRTYNCLFSPKSCYPRDQGHAFHDRWPDLASRHLALGSISRLPLGIPVALSRPMRAYIGMLRRLLRFFHHCAPSNRALVLYRHSRYIMVTSQCISFGFSEETGKACTLCISPKLLRSVYRKSNIFSDHPIPHPVRR